MRIVLLLILAIVGAVRVDGHRTNFRGTSAGTGVSRTSEPAREFRSLRGEAVTALLPTRRVAPHRVTDGRLDEDSIRLGGRVAAGPLLYCALLARRCVSRSAGGRVFVERAATRTATCT